MPVLFEKFCDQQVYVKLYCVYCSSSKLNTLIKRCSYQLIKGQIEQELEKKVSIFRMMR